MGEWVNDEDFRKAVMSIGLGAGLLDVGVSEGSSLANEGESCFSKALERTQLILWDLQADPAELEIVAISGLKRL